MPAMPLAVAPAKMPNMKLPVDLATVIPKNAPSINKAPWVMYYSFSYQDIDLAMLNQVMGNTLNIRLVGLVKEMVKIGIKELKIVLRLLYKVKRDET